MRREHAVESPTTTTDFSSDRLSVVEEIGAEVDRRCATALGDGERQSEPEVACAMGPRSTVGRRCSYVVTASVAMIRHRPMMRLAHFRRTRNLAWRTGFSMNR